MGGREWEWRREEYGGVEAQSQKIALRAQWLVYLLGLILPHSPPLTLLSLPRFLYTFTSFSLCLCLATFTASRLLPLPLSLHHTVTSLYSLLLSPRSPPLSWRLSPLPLLSISVSTPPLLPPPFFPPPCVLTWLSPPFSCYLRGLKNASCHLTCKQAHQTLKTKKKKKKKVIIYFWLHDSQKKTKQTKKLTIKKEICTLNFQSVGKSGKHFNTISQPC